MSKKRRCCIWRRDENTPVDKFWRGGCGTAGWWFPHDVKQLSEKMRFCPKCGKPIRVKKDASDHAGTTG
jgi:rRNA maturation endonuclease Nob1